MDAITTQNLIMPPIIALSCKSSDHTTAACGRGKHVLPLDQGQTVMLLKPIGRKGEAK
jgi:hypothetical protein